MVKWKPAAALMLCGSLTAGVVARTQQRHGDVPAAGSSFTADDYVEIQQLLARYGFALDTGANDGFMYADLYAPDGTFNNTKGRDALATLARGGRRGPANVRNFSAPAIILPSADGATGLQYAQAINFGGNGQPTELDHFGHYEDAYVRTPEGWRFKSRTFVNESGSLRAPREPAANRGIGAAPIVLPKTAPQVRQGSAKAFALTAVDEIEIQQLVAVANWALQTGAENGEMYAGLFASYGRSGSAVGHEQLAALARGGRAGARSLSTNVIVRPSAGGAEGTQYELAITFTEGDEPVAIGSNGRYEDEYVRTPAGWRFKRREFVASITTTEASQAALPATLPSPERSAPATPPSVPLTPLKSRSADAILTAQDYLDIQRLVASYGHALDSGIGRGDNGETYANLFAPGGIFGRPYTTGHDQLVRLAREQFHGRQYVRHFLTNMVIEPSGEGARGRQYLAVIDTAEGGKPGSVFLGGHYEDVYTKTPGGWRFKTRTLYPARTGAATADAALR